MNDRLYASHLEAIYGAVGDPRGWKALLELLAEDLGFRSGCMTVETFNRENLIDRYDYNYSDEERALVVEHFHKVDLWTEALYARSKGKFHASELMVPDETLKASEFYSDFLRPYDISHTVGICMDAGPGLALKIGLQSAGGMPSNLTRLPYLDRLAPHLQRAIDLENRLNRSGSRLDEGENLGGMNLPAVLVDRDGVIVSHNRSAEKLFARGSVLENSGGKLRVHASQQARFNKLLAHSLLFAQGRASMPGSSQVRLQDGETRYRLNVDPMQISDEVLGAAGRTLVLVTLEPEADRSKGELRPPERFEAAEFSRRYKLSPKETEVLIGLVRGTTLAEIARNQNRSVHTIRTHLKSLFNKTGTGSQAQLVARALS